MTSQPQSQATSKHRTISIGGATFDLFTRVDHSIIQHAEQGERFTLPLGAKVRVNEITGTCGGGASNTSVGLQRLGCAASFCGVIADDQWGAALMENFQKEGVDTSCVTIVEEETSSFSIVLLADTGERVILYDKGTNAHLHDVTFDRAHAAQNEWVYLNHIQADSCVIADDIVNILTSEPHPCLTWNPGGCQIDAGLREKNNVELLKHTSLLQLNKEEALRFTKQSSIDDALRALLDAGVQSVVITDGGKGVHATDKEGAYHCPGIPVDIVDTTGAGDAFGTGATWALLNGKDLPTALKAGSINAMSVVGSLGAQAGLLTETEMISRLNTLPLEVSTLSL